MKIGRKLTLGFGILLLFLVSLGVIVLFNVLDMKSHFSFVVEHDAPVIEKAQELSKLVVDFSACRRSFQISR